MTPDSGPLTVAYVLGAIGTALLLVAPLLLLAWLDSDNHRQRMARVRRYSKRQERGHG